MGTAGWQVVGYSDDPIPDDPGVVASQIAHLRTVAANIATQVAALPQSGQVDALVWSSQDNDAPQQFRKLAAQLPQDLDQLRTRYVKVAAALDDFHPVLLQTQAQARANLTIALSAHQDMQAAQTGVQQMNDFQYQAKQAAANQNQNLKPGQQPVQPAAWTGPNYPAILTDATTRFNNAKGQIDTAVQRFHGASQTAADRVNAASNDGLKNQSHGWGWGVFGSVFKSLADDAWHGIEKASHWVATHVPLAAISDLLGKITMVLALMSFIPVIGEIADTLALVTGGLLLACDAINAINDAYEGKFTWGGDGLGLGLDVVGVAFGGAGGLLERSAGQLAKGAEGFTKTADDIAKAAKADRLAKEAILTESQAGLKAAKSGLRGTFNRVLDVFDRGPLPAMKAGVRSDEAELKGAMEFESKAADYARQAHVTMKPFLTTGKILEKSTKATVWATNVGLSYAGVTHSVSSMDGLPAANGPWGIVKNVVVNSTVADVKAVGSAAEKGLLTLANYEAHAG